MRRAKEKAVEQRYLVTSIWSRAAETLRDALLVAQVTELTAAVT